jgi:adenylate cyclase class IV
MGQYKAETYEKKKYVALPSMLLDLVELLDEVGHGPGDYVEIEVIARGKTEKRMVFEIKNAKEIVEILKLNKEQ